MDLLDPQPGERVLDLGCGTGHPTNEIATPVGDAGAVVGIDQSAAMVAEARESSPETACEEADATEYTHESGFDAVYSNAALHWILDQERVVERVADLLSPGGRFVAEMGGHGNVARVVEATLLERHGFEVRTARLFDRPTKLEGGADGLRNWLGLFGDSLLAGPEKAERERIVEAVDERLRGELYDEETETWTAGYRRLRLEAVRAA